MEKLQYSKKTFFYHVNNGRRNMQITASIECLSFDPEYQHGLYTKHFLTAA